MIFIAKYLDAFTRTDAQYSFDTTVSDDDGKEGNGNETHEM